MGIRSQWFSPRAMATTGVVPALAARVAFLAHRSLASGGLPGVAGGC